MKKFILKITPDILIQLYIKYVYSTRKNNLLGNSADTTFKKIYKTNYWNSNESVSGTGSDLEEIRTIVKEINKIIERLDVKTILVLS